MTAETNTKKLVTKGLCVRLETQHGQTEQVEKFLTDARSLVSQEPDTTAWFAVRFGQGEYGIVDFFPDDNGRNAHLNGPVAQALAGQGSALLTGEPEMQRLEVLAEKLPNGGASDIRKGLLLTFAPKSEHETKVAQFLRDARTIVADEPGTLAWFALQFEDGRFGIFDVFADSKSRLKHLTGGVPRELAKHALELLGSLPDMDKCDVLAAKVQA
jgi:quinol monooxygenase YgiN